MYNAPSSPACAFNVHPDTVRDRVRLQITISKGRLLQESKMKNLARFQCTVQQWEHDAGLCVHNQRSCRKCVSSIEKTDTDFDTVALRRPY